jgi:hypothetical protein
MRPGGKALNDESEQELKSRIALVSWVKEGSASGEWFASSKRIHPGLEIENMPAGLPPVLPLPIGDRQWFGGS